MIKCFLRLFFLAAVIISGFQQSASAQSTSLHERKLIQFSGVIVSGDSLQPIPYSVVMIKSTRRGTITDYYGFFSFVAMEGDTINFQYIGYKPASFIIPDTLKENRYSLIQVLLRDTILLKETAIYPWPSREEFKRAFLNLKVPDDDIKRAERNLSLSALSKAEANVDYDGSINYKFGQVQQQSKLYTSGQFPSYNILNPIAWAAFIKAWQDGAFKKKDKEE